MLQNFILGHDNPYQKHLLIKDASDSYEVPQKVFCIKNILLFNILIFII